MSHTMVSSRTKWQAFFLDAGIPHRQATEYATTFSCNRMRLDMLDELNKEVLRDLGIKALGDIITILRYGKQKQFVMNRSPSPSEVETAIMPQSHIKSSPSTEKVKSTISLPTRLKSSFSNVKSENKMVTQKVNNVKNKPIKINNSKNIKTTTNRISVVANSIKKSSETMNSKVTRLKLSERFDEFETEAKRIKVEEKGKARQPHEVKCIKAEEKCKTRLAPEVKRIKVERKFQTNIKVEKKDQSRQAPDADLKVTPIQFTIQVPSKPPINASDVAKPKPKVTIVPARGKALNRSKYLTSIFDRLDAPSSSSIAVGLLKNDELAAIQKKNVFKRLGTKTNEPLDNIKNIQRVTAIVQPDTSPLMLDGKHGSESVFNRLGDHQLEDI